MRAPLRLALPVAVVAATLAAPSPARAVTVEKVVAVVGDRPILLSELRARARPFLASILAKFPPGPHQAAAESQVLQDIVQRLVDEELEVQAADHASVKVPDTEIDTALRNVATLQHTTIEAMLKEGRARSGVTEMDYREEIRRQILEGKMLQLRVKGRVRITEDDVKAMYERVRREERHHNEYEAAWIVLRILPGSSAEAIQERHELAAQLIARVRKGEHFSDLAKLYSDETSTRDKGGNLGIRAPAGSKSDREKRHETLAPELEQAVMGLDIGQVSEPIPYGDALVIMHLVDRPPSQFPNYDTSRPDMIQRLQQEILEKAKRKWLDELKARTHLEIRL